jgi:hypothetical protein
VFFVAGVWGFVVLTPLYFMFDLVGAVVWQIGFLVIGPDPARFTQ